MNCSEEGFRASQSVHQVAGPSSPEESATESCHHQCRAAQYWQEAGVNASVRTVRPRLSHNGILSRMVAKKPLLSKKNNKDRLKFCRMYKDWTNSFL